MVNCLANAPYNSLTHPIMVQADNSYLFFFRWKMMGKVKLSITKGHQHRGCRPNACARLDRDSLATSLGHVPNLTRGSKMIGFKISILLLSVDLCSHEWDILLYTYVYECLLFRPKLFQGLSSHYLVEIQRRSPASSSIFAVTLWGDDTRMMFYRSGKAENGSTGSVSCI